MKVVFEELFESKKEIFEEIMRIAYDSAHNFLFLNVPSQRIFKNWDEIIIHEDSDSDSENIEK
jgi:hypothetical protein